MGGWPWPLDSVQGWFESFWTTIERDIWDTFSGIQKSIGVIFTTIWKAAVWIKDEFLTLISNLDLFILTSFGTLFGWISASIQNATDTITGFFGGVHRAIALTWSNSTIQLFNVSNLITSSLTDAVGEIKARLDAGLTRVDFSLMQGITSMRSEFATIAALQRSEIDKVAGELEAINTEGIAGLEVWINKALQGFWTWLQENVFGPLFILLETGLAVVTNAVKAQIENLLNFMEMTAPRSPIGAVPAALAVLAVAAGTGVAITASGVALETLHPLKNMGVSAITGFIEKITGTEVIAAALIGTFVGVILREPLQQELNVVWRRTIPEVEQVLMLHTRAVIDTSVFENLMARLGYSDGLITSFWDAHWKLLDIDQAASLLWRGRITTEDFTRVMSLEGFHPRDLDHLVNLTELIPGPGELITFQVKEAFLEEFRTPAPPDFVGFMANQGFSEFWATTFWTSHWVLVPINQLYEMFHRSIIDAATLRQQLVFHDFRPEWVNKLVELSYRLPTRVEARFLYDIIGLEDPEIREILQAEGFAPKNVDRMMFYVKGFRLRALYGRMENAARRFFKEGLFTEDQFIELLQGGNFAPEVIAVDLQLARLERDFETKRDIVQAYREGFRKGLVTEEEFLEDLLALGVQGEQAGIIVAREKTRLTPKIKERITDAPRPLTSSQVVRFVKDGKITQEDGLLRLVSLGFRTEDAELMLEIPARALSASQVARLVKEDAITTESGLNRLVGLGFTRADSELLLLEKGRPLTASEISKLFRGELLTRDEALERLTDIGFTRADAELLLTELTRELTTSQIIKLFTGELIDREAALTRLLGLRFSRTDAELLLDEAAPIPAEE